VRLFGLQRADSIRAHVTFSNWKYQFSCVCVSFELMPRARSVYFEETMVLSDYLQNYVNLKMGGTCHKVLQQKM
jgi:hypothetical protein